MLGKRNVSENAANRRLELIAGQRALRVKAKSASLFVGGNQPKLYSDWQIEEQFLAGSRGENSRARIDIQQDVLTSEVFNGAYRPSEKIRCTGLGFAKSDIERAFPPVVSVEMEINGISKPHSSSSSGAKIRQIDWERFAAAFAYLADIGEIELDGSENAAHEKVASFLVSKGHKALSVDTVRPLIRRYRAWRAGHSYLDDTPLPASDE